MKHNSGYRDTATCEWLRWYGSKWLRRYPGVGEWVCSSWILKLTPKGDQAERGSRIFWPPKETNLGVAPAFFDPYESGK